MSIRILWLAMAACLFPSVAGADPASGKVRVFILAGQSNMEGKGSMKLAEYQAQEPRFSDFYRHLRKDGRWIVRDDVWINFLNRRGSLTVGFGSPNCIGPELEFGIVVGDRFEEQVLLIKTAWGGRSLGRDFLPPGAPMPADAQLQAVVDRENQANRQRNRPAVTLDEVRQRYGASYREMMSQIRSTLDELGQRFPGYQGQGFELAGFVWFQGWNDHIDAGYADAYASNLEHFIRDVRRDLDVPRLPFVIGLMGQNGFKPPQGGMLKVRQAQASMENIPEFRGTVKAVATDQFWDADADKLIANWRQDVDEWNKVGSDHGYHYLGSVRTFCLIGRAFGNAMVELIERP
jgi:hypothetical protein